MERTKRGIALVRQLIDTFAAEADAAEAEAAAVAA